MPGEKKPGPSVKDNKVYEAIRDQGGSKEKAARIANASAARSRPTDDCLPKARPIAFSDGREWPRAGAQNPLDDDKLGILVPARSCPRV